MSIIIKGVDMPKNCMCCPFPHVGVDWYYCYCPGVDGKAYDFKQAESIPDDCPLVELPDKHGDLIDRDEVRDSVFHHLSIKGEENLLPAEKSVFGNIIKAKAVIEAEGE